MIKFELNRLTEYSNEEIIREIQRVATLLNKEQKLYESFWDLEKSPSLFY